MTSLQGGNVIFGVGLPQGPLTLSRKQITNERQDGLMLYTSYMSYINFHVQVLLNTKCFYPKDCHQINILCSLLISTVQATFLH